MLVAEKYAGFQDAESKNVVILFVCFFFFFGKFWPQGEGEWETRTRNLRFMIFVVVMVAIEKGGDMVCWPHRDNDYVVALYIPIRTVYLPGSKPKNLVTY
jgi:hypothetical protein